MLRPSPRLSENRASGRRLPAPGAATALRRGLWLILLSLALPVAPAQDSRGREDPTGGALLTLPEGWRWQGTDPARLQAVRRLDAGTLHVVLESFPGQYALDHIEGYRRKTGIADFRVQADVSFAAQRHVTSLTFEESVKMGRGKEERRGVRLYLIPRDGTLFRWTEMVMKPASADAEAALEALRKGLKFKRPPGWRPPDKKRRFPNQRISYKLPRGWTWLRGKQGSRILLKKRDPTSQSPLPELFAVRRDILEQERMGALICALTAGAARSSARDQARFTERNLSSQYDQIRGMAYEELNFKGRKASSIFFSAVNKGGTRRFWRRTIFFKSKGILMLWTEISFGHPLEDYKREIKQARSGLRLG